MKSPAAPAQRVAAPVHEPQQQNFSEDLEMGGLEGGALSMAPADAIQRRQIQCAANACPQVQQMKTLQRMAFGSPQVQQMMQLKKAAQQFTGGAVQLKRPGDESLSATQGPLQRKGGEASGGGGGGNGGRGGLPENLRAGVESLSGLDMSDVRVHRNSDKPAAVGALAYAQGTDIHLGPGQEKHLPHEAWHVAQQKQGRVTATRQLKGMALNDDSALEREADMMGAKAMQMKAGEGQGARDERQGARGEGQSTGGGVQLKKQVQLKAKVAQARLRIGTRDISTAEAEGIEAATVDTDNANSGIEDFANDVATSYLFSNFAEMKRYNGDHRIGNMGEINNVWIRLNPAVRYLLGENHDASPRGDLVDGIHPTNMLYEGEDHIGRGNDGLTKNGRENAGENHGGIDHIQLQQLYIIAHVLVELNAGRDVDLYHAGALVSNAPALANSRDLLNGGQAVLNFTGLEAGDKQALIAALTQDFGAIATTTDTDFQGRVDPLSPTGQNMSVTMAAQLGHLTGAATPVQAAGQKDRVFGMRDRVMAGRINRNTPPLIAVMGALHIPGVEALVTAPKFHFTDLAAMLTSFGDGGAARLNMEAALGAAGDIPAPAPLVPVAPALAGPQPLVGPQLAPVGQLPVIGGQQPPLMGQQPPLLAPPLQAPPLLAPPAAEEDDDGFGAFMGAADFQDPSKTGSVI
jgi:hypothetical protein